MRAKWDGLCELCGMDIREKLQFAMVVSTGNVYDCYDGKYEGVKTEECLGTIHLCEDCFLAHLNDPINANRESLKKTTPEKKHRGRPRKEKVSVG
jgi:ribosome-binding protein aMBF1 (putative translation factor)